MLIGLKVAQQDTSWQRMRSLCEVADGDERVASFWLFDHLYPIFADEYGECLEGWTSLAALCSITRRIRLGLMVTATPYRNPGLLAKMAVTLDHVSEGRLELGLGAGWNESEAKAFGITLRAGKDRFDAFEEYLHVMEGILYSTEPYSFEGRFHSCVDAVCSPRSIQTKIPVIIGGSGPRRTLPLVARFADHWNFPFNKHDEWAESDAVLRGLCAEIGRNSSEIVRSVQVRANPERLGETVSELERWRQAGMDSVIIYLNPSYTPADLENLLSAVSA